MGRMKMNLKIDWRSKFIDLLIVIIGITIAFKLNNWNESIKSDTAGKEYIASFYNENKENRENLVAAIKFSETNKRDLDTLKAILLSKDYSDNRIKTLTAGMMAIANYTPSTITMQNISSSGEFDLIKDIELRKNLISTYNAYKTTTSLEDIISNYINQYVTPYFFKSIRFSDFSAIHSDFAKDPEFENIVFGYDVLLNQLINGYKKNLKEQNLLNKKLTTAKNIYK